MSHSYPSDISREQFVRILPTLESARRRTKPRTVNLYDVFCGVLYLLKSGCQWRMLPVDFPDWRTCYQYFRQWSERPGPGQDSILERVLKKSVGAARQSNGRKEQTSFCIVDSQCQGRRQNVPLGLSTAVTRRSGRPRGPLYRRPLQL